jgi:threonine dehydrogenase-like Zn-dependent dehydrogenase
VAVWGAGPVGQFAIRSAVMLGAAQVICIDNVPERLDMARAGGAVTIDFDEESVLDRLQELTLGKGPTSASRRSAWRRMRLRSIDSMVDRSSSR